MSWYPPIAIKNAFTNLSETSTTAFAAFLIPISSPFSSPKLIIAFLYAWNDFVFATILRNGHELMPMTVAIGNFFTQANRDWNAIMALNTMATIPLIVIFVFLQRWVIEGMTAGALKE